MQTYLKLISPPAIEPVTVSEAKIYCHIDYATDDTLIAGWIKTARVLAENIQKRAYIRQTWEVSFDRFPDVPFYLPRPPLCDVTYIKYYGTDNTEYDLDLNDIIIDTSSEPGRISLGYLKTWPTTTLRPIDAVKIRFIAGYNGSGQGTTTTFSPDANDVPSYVKDAIYLYCSYVNENRSGEVDKIPQQFYDILRQDRMFY